MFKDLKNRVFRPIRKWQVARLVDEGGAPASWYDRAYGGANVEYLIPYAQSTYLPVWEAICERIPTGASILEVGCGPGQLDAMIDDRVILRGYVGFDFKPGSDRAGEEEPPRKAGGAR